MIEIPLTRGFVALVDEADAALVGRHQWRALKSGKGTKVRWYASAGQGKATTLMHRLIMAAPIGMDVDHRDYDGLNNRRGNLRLATRSQNMANARMRSDNSTGFRGVGWHRQMERWRAYVRVDGRLRSLGLHDAPEDAARAYDAAAREAFGEFASLNFPEAA